MFASITIWCGKTNPRVSEVNEKKIENPTNYNQYEAIAIDPAIVQRANEALRKF